MMSSNTVDELIEQRDKLKEYLNQVTKQKAQVEVFVLKLYRMESRTCEYGTFRKKRNLVILNFLLATMKLRDAPLYLLVAEIP